MNDSSISLPTFRDNLSGYIVKGSLLIGTCGLSFVSANGSLDSVEGF
jgi:hypothetical protein